MLKRVAVLDVFETRVYPGNIDWSLVKTIDKGRLLKVGIDTLNLTAHLLDHFLEQTELTQIADYK